MIVLIVDFKACHNKLNMFVVNKHQLVTIYLQNEKMSVFFFFLRQIYDNYGGI